MARRKPKLPRVPIKDVPTPSPDRSKLKTEFRTREGEAFNIKNIGVVNEPDVKVPSPTPIASPRKVPIRNADYPDRVDPVASSKVNPSLQPSDVVSGINNALGSLDEFLTAESGVHVKDEDVNHLRHGGRFTAAALEASIPDDLDFGADLARASEDLNPFNQPILPWLDAVGDYTVPLYSTAKVALDTVLNPSDTTNVNDVLAAAAQDFFPPLPLPRRNRSRRGKSNDGVDILNSDGTPYVDVGSGPRQSRTDVDSSRPGEGVIIDVEGRWIDEGREKYQQTPTERRNRREKYTGSVEYPNTSLNVRTLDVGPVMRVGPDGIVRRDIQFLDDLGNPIVGIPFNHNLPKVVYSSDSGGKVQNRKAIEGGGSKETTGTDKVDEVTSTDDGNKAIVISKGVAPPVIWEGKTPNDKGGPVQVYETPKREIKVMEIPEPVVPIPQPGPITIPEPPQDVPPPERSGPPERKPPEPQGPPPPEETSTIIGGSNVNIYGGEDGGGGGGDVCADEIRVAMFQANPLEWGRQNLSHECYNRLEKYLRGV